MSKKVKADERSLNVEFLAKDAMTLNAWDGQFSSVIDSGLFHIYEETNGDAMSKGWYTS